MDGLTRNACCIILKSVRPFGSGSRAVLTIHGNPCRLQKAKQQGDGQLIYSSCFSHLSLQRVEYADDAFQFFFVTERNTYFAFTFLRAGELHFCVEES